MENTLSFEEFMEVVKEKAEVIFAVSDGKEIGFALFFHNFSTFLGRAGIYLEDLYVMPEYRGRGYGKAILKKLAEIAIDNLNDMLSSIPVYHLYCRPEKEAVEVLYQALYED